MKLVVIDGQGGRLGKLLVESVIAEGITCEITAIGTNSTATAAMMKAGASQGATGENPVIVACRDADVIAGPIGIISADSLLGEVTPAMAVAVGQSSALKLLLPVSHCNNQVIGVKQQSIGDMVRETVDRLKSLV
ncbi:MAG: DUF3842 family protein [Firmicutes bacterium]|nr:DUF3842 family protein [Bacillota bacterium]MBQ6261372.1 DUF3842 family protein [Bacillota bacterium]MBR0114022.1 DUF3842 family protein [Bacillota bacterium]MBR0522634.1 DUF3842 family protein [Bacillota bacterium]